ncbi:hypothetical protein SPRG_08336 [Saprolegnia parasitica CBS 223.65]|uniref:MSP domain-containing protein n=1 Tax=Saprolegnia parasitica (strain CBS 223.65) TaxID=695850 RepID=A0A067CAS9_SAPPC|nr:hypothetical protein SPRG_08336 [Saprolegnia parasitica CBS 223.65]KDO26260.1 hypothetical protein SPRG_08336 [Saprolegnia parasitica CBS 223.65]|eukprot:XP_012202969.1 hypothetical protein SPRG_08336 [Saprolegnia parasitica CBS 223.65]
MASEVLAHNVHVVAAIVARGGDDIGAIEQLLRGNVALLETLATARVSRRKSAILQLHDAYAALAWTMRLLPQMPPALIAVVEDGAANPQEDDSMTQEASSPVIRLELDPPVVLAHLDANLSRQQSFTLRNPSNDVSLTFKLRTPKALWRQILVTPNTGRLGPHESIAIVIELADDEVDRLTFRSTEYSTTKLWTHKLLVEARSDDGVYGAKQMGRFTVKATHLGRLLPRLPAPRRLYLASRRLDFAFCMDEETLQFHAFGNTCLFDVRNMSKGAALAVKFKTLCPTRYSIAPPFLVLPPGGARTITIALTRSTRNRLYVYEKSHLQLRDCLRVESVLVPHYATVAAEASRCPNELANVLDHAWRFVRNDALHVEYIPCAFRFEIVPPHLLRRRGVGSSPRPQPCEAF